MYVGWDLFFGGLVIGRLVFLSVFLVIVIVNDMF